MVIFMMMIFMMMLDRFPASLDSSKWVGETNYDDACDCGGDDCDCDDYGLIPVFKY